MSYRKRGHMSRNRAQGKRDKLINMGYKPVEKQKSFSFSNPTPKKWGVTIERFEDVACCS